MSTHSAVATVGVKALLGLIQVPTITPTGNQVRVRNEWTASTPLDLHQNDGGLLVSHPQVLGDGTAGTIVEVGPDVKNYQVGDKVFGFTWRQQMEKSHQEYVTCDEWLLAKLPAGFTLAQAVTLPNNFVTVFHALTTDLDIETPWPKPDNYKPAKADTPILIWGGSSSVGQFALQILKYYGYSHILTTASQKHHAALQDLGASKVYDYNDTETVNNIVQECGPQGVTHVLDCIGSQYGSIVPVSQIAKARARVAILLPVVVRDSTDDSDPEYEMDVRKAASWHHEVDVHGVRTHFYLDNTFFKYHLQPDIMPTMLANGTVRPQKQRLVEGDTMLARAQTAMNMLRKKEASMERLVWRVAE